MADSRCGHCGQSIIPCQVTNCPGWQSLGCTGWEHYDLFHGCPGGQHGAEPARVSVPGQNTAERGQ